MKTKSIIGMNLKKKVNSNKIIRKITDKIKGKKMFSSRWRWNSSICWISKLNCKKK